MSKKGTDKRQKIMGFGGNKVAQSCKIDKNSVDTKSGILH